MLYVEFKENKMVLFNNIKTRINKSINQLYTFGYESEMLDEMLWGDFDLNSIIRIGLIKLGMDEKRSSDISYHICYGIQGFLTVLLDKHKDLFTPEILSNIIYKNIKWQLEDGGGDHYLDDLEIISNILKKRDNI